MRLKIDYTRADKLEPGANILMNGKVFEVVKIDITHGLTVLILIDIMSRSRPIVVSYEEGEEVRQLVQP